MTNDEILDFEYEKRDHGTITIRHYFYLLLFTLWKEGEGFDGKRPFGNSGWEYDIYEGLVKCGAVAGEFENEEDEYPCLVDFDKKAANKLVFDLIEHVFGKGGK